MCLINELYGACSLSVVEGASAVQVTVMIKKQNWLMESVEPVCTRKVLGHVLKLSCTSELHAMINSIYADRYSTQ